ncbi:MAG: hypothetical protein WCE51_01885 [Chthoniobacterales bacterium]
MSNLNWFAYFYFLIDCDQFRFSGPLTQNSHDFRVHHRDLVSELDNLMDAGGIPDIPMPFPIDELRKKVSREHCLNEPHRAASGRPAEAKARCKAVHLQIFSQPKGRKVLALRLRLETKPKRLCLQKQLLGS